MATPITASSLASRTRCSLPGASHSDFLRPAQHPQSRPQSGRRRASTESSLSESDGRELVAPFESQELAGNNTQPYSEEPEADNEAGYINGDIGCEYAYEDEESPESGKFFFYGSYANSDASDCFITDEDTSQGPKEVEPRPGQPDAGGRPDFMEVGAIFEPSTPPSPPDESTDETDLSLQEGNLPEVSEFRRVKDQPSLAYVGPGGAASDISNGWTLEYAQSQRSFGRSVSSFRSGNDKNLQARLMGARAENPWMEKLYYPRSVFTSIVTRECVEQELRKSFPNKDSGFIKNLTQTICGNEASPSRSPGQSRRTKAKGLKRIFVILILLKMTTAIEQFIEDEVDDSDLPLWLVKRPGEQAIFDLCRFGERDKPLEFFTSSWDVADIENFWEKQWTTLAPKLSQRNAHKKVWHYKLQSHAILPYIRPEKASDGGNSNRDQNFAGGSAQVSRVYVHHKHHNLQTSKFYSGSFALKHLHSASREAFKNEVDMLRKFSHDAHDHLISLLLTYEQNSTFFLLFDWAECNLKDYWQKVNPMPCATDRETVLWVGEQCQGIAHGVLYLHRYHTISRSKTSQVDVTVFGHHGDIKEENILWFTGDGPGPGPIPPKKTPNRGVLKLADFGIGQFSPHRTSPLAADAHFVATPSYRAPESDAERPSAQGRSYDIWTLGILYLQFVTWMIGGWDALGRFKERRLCADPGWHNIPTDTFFERDPTTVCVGEAGHIIKPAVTEAIKELHRNPLCTRFLHDFLKIIETQMLIVKNRDSTDRDRIEASELYAGLKKMVDRCKSDHAYGCEPVQWRAWIDSQQDS